MVSRDIKRQGSECSGSPGTAGLFREICGTADFSVKGCGIILRRSFNPEISASYYHANFPGTCCSHGSIGLSLSGFFS